MMKRFSILFAVLLATFVLPIQTIAQELSTLEETFYSSGKINVVLGVFSIIIVGLFIYLFRLDKMLKQLEEEVKK
jgi:CcmD family protein